MQAVSLIPSAPKTPQFLIFTLIKSRNPQTMKHNPLQLILEYFCHDIDFHKYHFSAHKKTQDFSVQKHKYIHCDINILFQLQALSSSHFYHSKLIFNALITSTAEKDTYLYLKISLSVHDFQHSCVKGPKTSTMVIHYFQTHGIIQVNLHKKQCQCCLQSGCVFVNSWAIIPHYKKHA